MSAIYKEIIPAAVFGYEEVDGATIEAEFTFTPGMDACGPAYDHGGLPAEPPEIEIIKIVVTGPEATVTLLLPQGDDSGEAIIEYLMENWEPPTGPDPDDERDRRRDEELVSRP